MTATAIVERPGDRELLGEVRGDLELARAIQRGLPSIAVRSLLERGDVSIEEANTLVISRRALSSRIRRGQPLTPAESDRLARITRVIALAEETFGNRDKARRWLRKPNRGLRGHVPIELLRLEAGGKVVEQALHRISHGIPA